jgi:hypothetical protein
VWDLNTNHPEHAFDVGGRGACSLQSWSNQSGSWKGLCYIYDYFYESGMWSKPSEVSSYLADGFEITLGGGGSYIVTPTDALDVWKCSPSNNNVIIEKGWSRLNTMGVGMLGNYAVIWFGFVADTAQMISACP